LPASLFVVLIFDVSLRIKTFDKLMVNG